jgi:D-alanine-D-alanine ligase
MAEHPGPDVVTLPGRVRLVVLFGGRSAEHEISRVSASHVLRAVDPTRYEVVPVGITREGRWVRAAAAAELIGGGRAAELPESVDVEGDEVDPLPVLATGPGEVPTVVLPILHGPNGEDGTVQGLLELAGVPYVGSGVLGSAVAMDKAMAKTVLEAHGIAQARWRAVDRHELERLEAEGDGIMGLAGALLDDLGPTLFVKPANMGSSIGVSKVTAAGGPEAVAAALAEALRYDELVVVEEGLVVRELECGVLGNDEPRASVVGEIVAAADFYDFDDKYVDGAARTEVPAALDEATAEEARRLAVTTFRALRCSGMARVDMFLEEHGRHDRPGRGLLVNEVNTIPGFTPISMYPKMWQASGVGYPQLVDELVRLALERHARRSAHATSPG